MKYVSGLRLVYQLALPLGLSLVTGCAAIGAQNLAGQGNRLVDKGQVDEALVKFEASIAKQDNGTAHAGRAEALMQQGRYSEAEKDARTAIKLTEGAVDSSVIKYNLILSKAQLLQGHGAAAFESATTVVKRLSGMMSDPPSKALVKKALLLQIRIIQATGKAESGLQRINDPQVEMRWPDDLDFRAEHAIIQALMQDYDAATATADSVLKLNSNHGEAKLARAMAQAASGDIQAAKATLGDALERDHTRVMVFLNAAHHVQESGKKQEAVDLLKFLATVQPNNHLIHNDLAVLYRDLDMIPESIEEHETTLRLYPSIKPYTTQTTVAAFKEAVKKNPPGDLDLQNMAGYYESLSYLYSRVDDPDKALDALRRVAVLAPSAVVYQNIGAIYDRKDDPEKALDYMEKALEFDPGNADVLKAMGTLAFKAQKCDRAVGYLDKASKATPDDFDSHLNLGVVQYNCELYEDAIDSFKAALSLKADHVETLFNLGVTQVKLKRKKEALKTLLRVVELNENYPDAYREIGTIYLDKRQYKKAEKYYALEDKFKGATP